MSNTTIHCRALIFDLDGVLVDSTAVVERHWHQFAEKHHLNPAKVINTAHGRRTEETIQLLTPHLDIEKETSLLVNRAAYDTEGLKPIKGALELINNLPGAMWAVATSGSTETAVFRLKFAGLPLPAILITADDVREGKPHPEAYLLASKRLDIKPGNCIVIEDSPAGVAAARAAGMKVIAIPTTHTVNELQHANYITDRLSDLAVKIDAEELAISF